MRTLQSFHARQGVPFPCSLGWVPDAATLADLLGPAQRTVTLSSWQVALAALALLVRETVRRT